MSPTPYPCSLHDFIECSCAVLYGLDHIFFSHLLTIAQGLRRILFFEGHPGLHIGFLQRSSFRCCEVDDVTLGVLAYRIFRVPQGLARLPGMICHGDLVDPYPCFLANRTYGHESY